MYIAEINNGYSQPVFKGLNNVKVIKIYTRAIMFEFESTWNTGDQRISYKIFFKLHTDFYFLIKVQIFHDDWSNKTKRYRFKDQSFTRN